LNFRKRLWAIKIKYQYKKTYESLPNNASKNSQLHKHKTLLVFLQEPKDMQLLKLTETL
jgi:hypothetical protein